MPAHYATGFVVTERSPYGGYWIARNADAHAWVEACDDNGRWVTVEPTPAGGVPSSVGRGGSYYLWDSVKFSIHRFVAMLQQGGTSALGSWFLGRLRDLIRAIFTTQGRLIVSICLAGIGGWVVLRGLRRPMPRPRDPVLRRLQRLLERMDRRVRVFAGVRSQSETLAHFARRLERQAPANPPAGDAARWYLAYAAVRYGGHADAEEAARLERQMPPGVRKRRVRSNGGRPA